MRDIWSKLIETLTLIWTYLQIAWFTLCGVTNRTDAVLLSIVRGAIIVSATALVFFFVGFAFNIEGFVVFGGVLAALTFFLTWKLTSIGVGIITAIGRAVGKTPIIGKTIETPINALNEEIKKLLYPLIVVSLTCSFVAAVAAIRGPGCYTFHDMVIQSTMTLFMIIFIYWLDAKTKLAGWVMILALGYFWILYYAFPIQAMSLVVMIDRYTINLALISNDGNKDNELVSIPSTTPLFEKSKGRFAEIKISNRSEVKAKVISQSKDSKSGEPMYFVVLPVSPNLYVGGKEVFVPVRMVKVEKKKDEEKIQTSTAPIVVKPGDPLRVVSLKIGEKYGPIAHPGEKRTDLIITSRPQDKFDRVFTDNKQRVPQNQAFDAELRSYYIEAVTDCQLQLKAEWSKT